MSEMEGEGYLLESELPFRFCPGCTHGTALEAAATALDRVAPDRRRTVVVSDIGCVGLSDRYLGCSTFHGLHGRSIAYAMGLKVARPDLTVVTLIGDGGIGIGAGHLVAAARRNAGIAVLVFDNFNFGMTGGQQSVTTFTGGVTSTSPGGNPERPLDICAVARAAGATFVARASGFDRELPDIIAKAIAHPGFALVDIWEVCTAHYMKGNQFRRGELESALAGVDRGILVREERPELSRTLRTDPAPAAPHPLQRFRISAPPAPHRRGTRSLVVAGSAGMKVRYAASLLSRAAILSGLRAAQQDEFPITVLTGYSLSDVIVSDAPIDHIEAEPADFLLALADEGYARFLARGRQARRIYRLPGVTARTEGEIVLDGGRARREHAALWAIAQVARREELLAPGALQQAVTRHGYQGKDGRDLAAQLQAVEG